jgi:hypothetical protein
MINLLPPNARRNVIREYWLRVATVWMFLLGTGCLIVAALLLPTYVQIQIQLNALSESMNASTETISSYDTLARELVVANDRSKILLNAASSTPFSVYVTNIEQLSGQAISINTYTFTRPKTGEATIAISGIARTRQELADFKDVLSSEGVYSRVDLPISNLIKEKDLLFSMQLFIATSTHSI